MSFRFIFSITTALLLTITGCSSSDGDDSDNDAYVKTPAWPILSEEQVLESYFQKTYDYDESRDYHQDQFRIFFNQYKPASNTEPDEDDLDQTPNDLLFSETNWKDDTRAWESNDAILSSENAVYSKSRAYRLWQNGQLGNAVTRKNQMLHEAIDEDVFSYFLGTQFVWDFGDHLLAETEDLSTEKLEDFQTTPEGLALLQNSEEWADVDRVEKTFSNGAKYYPLTFSVVNNNTVVEAVAHGQGYSLSITDVAQGLVDLTAFVSQYQEPNRFEYRFSTSPRDNHSLYISFDSGTQTAIFSEQNTGASLVTAVPFQLTDSQQVLEIDVQSISRSKRSSLNFSGLFNPVIIGPVNEGGNSHYYYGKRYIKTTEANRDNLPVLVLFNATAANDIRSAFTTFRQEKFDDQL